MISAGCSTRQISEEVNGSTAQRLVTYSVEKFVARLVEHEEFEIVENRVIELNLYFTRDHTLLDYTRELIRYQLEKQYNVEIVSPGSTADYSIGVFFNSIGTDYDSYGLSIPTFGLATTPNARLSVLSVDMYHGVTEGYAVLREVGGGRLFRTEKTLARVRADNVSTPIFDFPVNQLK
jgi:hypothetical protein